MELPDHVPVTAAAVAAIVDRHGLGARDARKLPDTGIINGIYLLGDDLILRVPRDHAGPIGCARQEAAAIPAARAAGVRTPPIVAFDDRCDLLPVPYLIVERVPGAPLALPEEPEPAAVAEVWRELGRDFGRLHRDADATVLADAPAASVTLPDARPLLEQRITDGWITRLEARWLGSWLDRLAPLALTPVAPCLIHGDPQATNILVQPHTRRYMAVIDWGCARRADPAWDFIGMPMRAATHVLAGHREVAPLASDDTAEARIIWAQLYIALELLPRGAAPGCSWGERPLAMLLELMRFFMELPGGRWGQIL